MFEYLVRIGEQAAHVSLLVAVISTMVLLALLAGGAGPELVSVPLFVGVRPFYGMVSELSRSLPREVSTGNAAAVGFTVLVTMLSLATQFITMSVTMYLLLTVTVLSLLPNELLYLGAPLAFLFTFVQLAVLAYYAQKVYEVVRAIKPF